MDDFVKMDVFFVVSTVAVVLVTVLVSIVLYYLIRILREVARVAGHISQEADALRADIAHLREGVAREGFKFKHALRLITSVVRRRRSKREE